MSETQNTPVEIDPLDNLMQEEEAVKHAESLADEEGRIFLPPTPIVQAREVILPVIMRKGESLAILGDAVFDSESCKMVVSFNTQSGRDIAEFIGSGMLAAISFTGHMPRNETTNKLN
jgi:hypothetical protein